MATFSFLHPWLWWGALMAAVPLYLHLRRRAETNLVRFSAVQFLDDTPQPRRSPWRLRDLLLLAARLLALLLLIAAFAWPFLPDPHAVVVRESRVYLLDNTLSHQVDGGFIRDRDRLVADVGRLGPDIQIAVLELTSQPRMVTSFGEERATAQRKLSELQPSFERGSYLAAFRMAHQCLRNALGQRKRILFRGDHQENQWTEDPQALPFLQDIEVDLPKINRVQASNLALVEPRVQRVFQGTRSLLSLAVHLIHLGEAKTARVTVRANEQVVWNRAVDLDQQPETILLQAQWESDPRHWIQGDVTVEGGPDALSADNRVFFVLPPVREGSVVLLAQSPYLRVALSPEIMQGYWTNRVLTPADVAAELASDRRADVFVLESGYLQSPDTRKLVTHYLSHGRGVFLLVDRVTPVINGALRELGFDVLPAPESPGRAAEQFEMMFSQHPIFRPFSSMDFGPLHDIRVFRYARLKAVDALPLLFSQTGDALFFQGAKWPGQLLVAAFGADRQQTTWPLHPSFVPFLDLCLQNARAQDTFPTDYQPGQPCVVSLPADSTVREVVLRDRQGERQRAAVSQFQARLRMPNAPGIYTISHDASPEPQTLVSVNPPPKESQLKYLPEPEAIARWQLPRPAATAVPVPARTAGALTAAEIWRQEYWWWLLLGGLALLILEGVWSTVTQNRAKSDTLLARIGLSHAAEVSWTTAERRLRREKA